MEVVAPRTAPLLSKNTSAQKSGLSHRPAGTDKTNKEPRENRVQRITKVRPMFAKWLKTTHWIARHMARPDCEVGCVGRERAFREARSSGEIKGTQGIGGSIQLW